MKGRPPGTKKSDDPNKKKRKRQARERDQCDVKIKITEYFPGARLIAGAEGSPDGQVNNSSFASGQSAENQPPSQGSPAALDHANLHGMLPGADGARYYTIQRVNGNGANGKGDGTVGGHRHSLEDSDKIKKNSIHRHFLKEDKERRKSTVRVCPTFSTHMNLSLVQSESFPRSPSSEDLRHRHLHFVPSVHSFQQFRLPTFPCMFSMSYLELPLIVFHYEYAY